MDVKSSQRGLNKAPEAQDRNRRGRKLRNLCVGLTVVVVVIIILIVILAFTVFKPKHPVSTIDSIALDDLSLSMDIAALRIHLNVSLDVDLSIRNPNKVGFKYSNSSALLNYRGKLVGEAPIPAGKISSGETSPMNLTLTLMADRFLSDSQLISDATAGELPLNTFVKLSGKVIVFSIFKFHLVSTTSCDFTVFIPNRSVGNQQCQYKTKL